MKPKVFYRHLKELNRRSSFIPVLSNLASSAIINKIFFLKIFNGFAFHFLGQARAFEEEPVGLIVEWTHDA